MGNYFGCLLFHKKEDGNEARGSSTPYPSAAAPSSPSADALLDEGEESQFFFDALETLPSESLSYAPADKPMCHKRGSVFMDNPSTLLHTSDTAAPTKRRRRSTIFIRQKLQDPTVRVEVRGYPGDLTAEELDAAIELRRALNEHDDSAYREMVLAFKEVEEEPYALCRYLRARDFQVADSMAMIGNADDSWKQARENDFFPTIESAVGCSGSVLLTQYPYIFSGNAKNGCPVNYQAIGRTKTEGIECITDLDKIKWYVMHSIMFQFKNQVAVAQAADPDVVRVECISVIDLKGLDSSQLNKKTLAALESIGKVTQCFPEMLNRMIVINTPSYFSFFWALIKGFLDKRTAAKIELYSREAKGHARLRELIDEKELLSNYSGSGPSFETIAQKSSRKANGSTRQTAELMTMNGKSQCVVELNETEKMTVYYYSRFGADVTILKENVKVKTTEVESPHGDAFLPFYTELLSESKGPGKIFVSATPTSKGSATDYFVIHVEVFPV